MFLQILEVCMPVQVVPKRSVVEWDAFIGDLMNRHDAMAGKVAAIVEERRKHALAAVSGDAAAAAKVKALNDEQAALVSETDTLAGAIADAGVHRRAQAEVEEAQHRAQTLAEAEQVTAALVATSAEVDQAFQVAAAKLMQRRELANRLGALGFKANRLYHAEPIARAAGAAGLRTANLPAMFGPAATWTPLADVDRGTLDAVLSPVRQAVRAQRRAS
jgi:hypothetical protein